MLKIPLARDVDSGKLMFPSEATRKKRLVCIDCDSELHVRAGPKRVRHFAHNPKGTSSGGCGGGEGIIHKSTKEWISQNVSNPEFTITSRCTECMKMGILFTGNPRFSGATEIAMGSRGQYKIDAVCFNKTKCVACIEVYHTHRTDSTKMAALAVRSYDNAFEVKAVNLVDKDWPLSFRDIRPRRCTDCIRSARLKRLEEQRHRATTKASTKWIQVALGGMTAFARKALITKQKNEERTRQRIRDLLAKEERRRRMRKCVDCGCWGDCDSFDSYTVPRARFPEWVCNTCRVACVQCTMFISKKQAKFGGKCYECNLSNQINGPELPHVQFTDLTVCMEEFTGSFYGSKTFLGSREGYVFKNGDNGCGYYRDNIDVI